MSTRRTPEKAQSSDRSIHIKMICQDQSDVKASFRISEKNYAFLCELSDFLRKLLPHRRSPLSLFGGTVLNILFDKPTSDIDVAIATSCSSWSVMDELMKINPILTIEDKQFLCSKHAVDSGDWTLSTEIIGEIIEGDNDYATVTLKSRKFGKIDLVRQINPKIMDAAANSIIISMNDGYDFTVFASTKALWELYNSNVYPLQLWELLPSSYRRNEEGVLTSIMKKDVQNRFTRVLRRLWKLLNKFETVQCVSTKGGEDSALIDLEPVTEKNELLSLMITPECGHPISVLTLYSQVLSKLSTINDGENPNRQDYCPQCRAKLCVKSKSKMLFNIYDLDFNKEDVDRFAEEYYLHIHNPFLKCTSSKSEVEELRDLLFEVEAREAGEADEAREDSEAREVEEARRDMPLTPPPLLRRGGDGVGGAGSSDPVPPGAPRRSRSSLSWMEEADIEDARWIPPSEEGEVSPLPGL